SDSVSGKAWDGAAVGVERAAGTCELEQPVDARATTTSTAPRNVRARAMHVLLPVAAAPRDGRSPRRFRRRLHLCPRSGGGLSFARRARPNRPGAGLLTPGWAPPRLRRWPARHRSHPDALRSPEPSRAA